MAQYNPKSLLAPLGDVEHPSSPFEITSMDIIGPYALTPRQNKYLLTFIYHFTKYTEAYANPDQTDETCDRVYAIKIFTRHGTVSKLITDQDGHSCQRSFKRHAKYSEYA